MKGDNFEMIGILWPFYGMCSHMLKIVGNSSEIEMVVIFNVKDGSLQFSYILKHFCLKRM